MEYAWQQESEMLPNPTQEQTVIIRDEPLAAHYRQAYFASTYGDDSVAPMRRVRRNTTIGYRLGEFAAADEQVAA